MFNFSDKTNKILKYAGAGAVALGTGAIIIGGGTEGYAVEIVGAIANIIGIVLAVIKK